MPKVKTITVTDYQAELNRVNDKIREAESELEALESSAKTSADDPREIIDRRLHLLDSVKLYEEERRIIASRVAQQQADAEAQRHADRIAKVRSILQQREATLKQLDKLISDTEAALEALVETDAELLPLIQGTDTAFQIANRGHIQLLQRILDTHGKHTDRRLDKTKPWPKPSAHGAKLHEQLLSELADAPRRKAEELARQREGLKRIAPVNYPNLYASETIA